MRFLRRLPVAALLAAPVLSAQIMYVGTYTNAKVKGIYAYRFDAGTGKLASLGLAAESPNPSFLAVHPNGKYLYAVNEMDIFQGKPAGSVSAFSVDRASGKLRLLNTVSSGGAAPCHLVVDHTGRAVLVANYNGGSFASFPVLADGKLGTAASLIRDQGSSVDKTRQSEAHGHAVVLTRDNQRVLAADLGTDKVMVFRLDAANAKLTPNDPPSAAATPGAGPRHLVIAPDEKHVYVLNELNSTVTTFAFEAKSGSLRAQGTVSALPSSFKGENSGAEIQIDAAGRYVYTSNRGHNSIAVFAVDPATAGLKLIETVSTGGKTPRGFVLDPSGNWLIAGNQDSGDIAVFKVDRASGKLTRTADRVQAGSPVTFAFVK